MKDDDGHRQQPAKLVDLLVESVYLSENSGITEAWLIQSCIRVGAVLEAIGEWPRSTVIGVFVGTKNSFFYDKTTARRVHSKLPNLWEIFSIVSLVTKKEPERKIWFASVACLGKTKKK